MAEVAGWFKQSSDRIYTATAPIADFETPLALGPGTHKIEVPTELAGVDELIVPTSYKAMSNDEPAFALFIFYLQAGLVEVLPQKWFTAAQYRVGQQWITRAARDPESQRIMGECFGVGTFSAGGRWLPPRRMDRALHLDLSGNCSCLRPRFELEEIQEVRLLRLFSDDGTNRLTRRVCTCSDRKRFQNLRLRPGRW